MKEIHAVFPPKFRQMAYIIINGEKFINSAFEYKKAASPKADQSKGLTENETTETGCRDHCTTAAAGKQGVNA